MTSLGRFSLGTGDRFGHQGEAQLEAVRRAVAAGVEVTPVWNKSNREHNIIGTEPSDTRKAADAAVKALGWDKAYFVDADHINLTTVDRFLNVSNFFTIDVADFIGEPTTDQAIAEFLAKAEPYMGGVTIPRLKEPVTVSRAEVEKIARHYLFAAQKAGEIYRYIAENKLGTDFIAEVSMDETNDAQTPRELIFILQMLALEGVPARTIAPKFTGRFNKGVDYVGNLAGFEKEFFEDLAVIDFAVKEFGLPEDLKVSVHSGSDKFSLYPIIAKICNDFGAGWHLKTAGTTWLEELIGLAEAGGGGLEIAKRIYSEAHKNIDALCQPYATVIDIDRSKLPTPEVVNGWDGTAYVGALRHDQSNPAFNPNVRQLLHVGFKCAAKLGDEYLQALVTYREDVARNVTGNLYDRHLVPLMGL